MNFTEFKDVYKSLKSEKERINFINKRINELELFSDNDIDRIGKNQVGSYKGFIPRRIGLASIDSCFSDLTLDDMSIYKDFMNSIDNDVDEYLYGEPSTIIAIQKFIWSYFGYNSGYILKRMDIYSDNPDKMLSVKELKGKNIAACSERSALAQNLLTFLGFESEIIFGKLNETESHAYIVFKMGNGKAQILYDPMNPVEYTVEDKKYYAIGVCILDNEEYMNLKNGSQFEFSYDLVKKLYGSEYSYNEKERTYSCDDAILIKNQAINK